MKFLTYIKDKATLLLMAGFGIVAVLATHFRHVSRTAKDKLKQVKHARQAEKLAVKAAHEENIKREARENEIQSDDYDPRNWFSRNNR